MKNKKSTKEIIKKACMYSFTTMECRQKAVEEDKAYFEIFQEEINSTSISQAIHSCIHLKKIDMLKFILNLEKANVTSTTIIGGYKALIEYGVDTQNLEIFKLLYSHDSYCFIKHKNCIYEKVIAEGTAEQLEFLINDHKHNSFWYHNSYHLKYFEGLIKDKEYKKINVLIDHPSISENSNNNYSVLTQMIKVSKRSKEKEYRKILKKLIKNISHEFTKKLTIQKVRLLFLNLIHANKKYLYNSIFFNKKFHSLFIIDQEIISRMFDFNNIYIYKYYQSKNNTKDFDDVVDSYGLIYNLVNNKSYDFLIYLSNNKEVNWKNYLSLSINEYEKFALYLIQEKKLKNKINEEWINKNVVKEKREKYNSLLKVCNF